TLFSIPINDEIPGPIGIFGIVFVLLGTYFIKIGLTSMKRIIDPIKSLFSDKAALMVFGSSAIYGLIYAINKRGIEESSASFFTFSAALGMLIVFSLILFTQIRIKSIPANEIGFSKIIKFLPIGIVDGVKVLFFMLAISNTLVPYADASDNTAAIYSSIFAYLFFGEKVAKRIVPILLMITGVILISISFTA
ncbi:MAG: EamA family transporter, partial [Candidatus Dojkabacteria bacterium]